LLHWAFGFGAVLPMGRLEVLLLLRPDEVIVFQTISAWNWCR
jgi:hypothetical protein